MIKLLSVLLYSFIIPTGTLTQTTVAQCEKTICPTLDCKNPIRLDGECCDRCGENLSGVELETLDSEPKNCVIDGVIYEHDSTFHPPSDNMSHTAWPYCTVYTCKNGTLEYSDASATCPPIVVCDASEAFHVEGSCCKVCPEVVLKNGECKDELGNPRSFNETWNLYSAHYQERITCLNCSCKGSTFTCVKDPCPTVPRCTGEEEQEEIQICCPKCSNAPPKEESTPTEEIPLKTCTHTHRVYLCNSTSMAIENVKNESVIMYVWLLNGVKQAFPYSSAEFQQFSCSDPSNYQGGTKEIRVNGLQNRESKRLRILNCKKDCAEMVVKMLRTDRSC